MTYQFTKPAKRSTSAQPADQAGAEYRGRAAAESDRYDDAIHIDTWLSFSFPSLAGLDQWRAEFGPIDNQGWLWADDIDWTPWRPAKPRRGFGHGDIDKGKPPEPTPPVPDTGDLEADFLTWLESVHQLLLAADREAKPGGLLLQSGVYILLCFDSQASKEKWVSQMGLSHLGEKYMDGLAVLDIMRRNHG